METQLRFRRPIHIGEIDQGRTYEDAIITYVWQPDLLHARKLSKEEAKEKGYKFENTVDTYRKYLLIDLWFIVIRLKWITKSSLELTEETPEQS